MVLVVGDDDSGGDDAGGGDAGKSSALADFFGAAGSERGDDDATAEVRPLRLTSARTVLVLLPPRLLILPD